MRMYRAYCSACDARVRVIPLTEFPEEHWPEDADPESVVCLDKDESCTGVLCPLFEAPTDEMRELVRKADVKGEGTGG